MNLQNKRRGEPGASDTRREKLHKMLALAGYGSRREMERWIAEGRITLNGKPATVADRVGDMDSVRVDGKPARLNFQPDMPRVLLYHKPDGEIVSRSDPEGRPMVFSALPPIAHAKWIAVGRLDFNTSGLLLFTTSGELANRLMHPSSEIEREYAVRVIAELTDAQLTQLRRGVPLDDGMARFTSISKQGGEGTNRWYRVTLNEGRNREVRRLFEAIHVQVSRLIRVRFGSIRLSSRLRRGQWMEMPPNEVAALMGSFNAEAKPTVSPRRVPRNTSVKRNSR